MPTRKRVYLAGPIFNTANPGQWRAQATQLFGADWDVLDPVLFEVDLTSSRDIVGTDLAALRSSHVVLAKCEDASWGTAMELCYAKHVCVPRIPVVAWAIHPGRSLSPWLLEHVSYRMQSLDGAVELARRIAL